MARISERTKFTCRERWSARHLYGGNSECGRDGAINAPLMSVNTLSDIPLQPRTQSCKKIPIPHLNRKRRRREKIGINKNKNSPSKSSPNTSDRSFALRGRSPVKLEKVKDGESSTHEIVDLEKSRIYFLPPILAGFHAVGLSPGRKSGRY
ncbi:hypothetical protein TNCV_1033101 [Trichonephila clavipes]|nr:hypothetical protein TNCV_1033101 [Trichonephila clavipes]